MSIEELLGMSERLVRTSDVLIRKLKSMEGFSSKAYFDRTGLHKPGEVVEVSSITNLVKPIKEVKVEKVEETEATEEEKPKKEKKASKKKG